MKRVNETLGQNITSPAEGFFLCSEPVVDAGCLTSSIALTLERNMLIILICIHWLECGRHELSFDLCSNRSQICMQYSALQYYCKNIFPIISIHRMQS